MWLYGFPEIWLWEGIVKYFFFSLVTGLTLALTAVSCFAQAPDPATHAPSGGTRMTLESIAVPPIANAPFTATVKTEWKRTLEDGSVVVVSNHRTIARDNSGRVYQERRNLTPSGMSITRQFEYGDPSTHEVYYCKPGEQVCEIHNYFPLTTPPPVAPTGPIGDGNRFLTRTDLGSDTIGGVQATGTRETLTFNAGTIGNDRPVAVVKEFWYSSQLGINLIEKREDPRVGTQTFTVTDITLGEPDARLFQMPSFRVVDARTPRPQDSNPNAGQQ
jgi:hypothetical protein